MFQTLRTPQETSTSIDHLTQLVSCLDSRSNPYQVLGLKPYEAIVLRNVSGRFTPVEVDIAALDTRFDVSQIILLQHTNCGASTITVKDMIESVQENRPELIGTQELADLEPRFPSVDHNSHRLLNLELQAVKNSKILRKDLIDNVVGLYLNVDTGLVEVVSPESTTV